MSASGKIVGQTGDSCSMTMNQLQKAKDISDLLQVSESTVIRMAYSGDLPYIPLRSGKRKKIIRFDPVEIEKWVKKRTS
jgi:predicted DNA-binding transcriptional regulator AlpA